MTKPPPKIDPRTATQITEQVQDLLVQYAPGWQEFDIDPVTQKRQLKGISAALIGIFGRFSEIIIQRLNQVPNKNFLAFLDLLGASRLPPQPARVPLTFSLTAGSAVDAIVPVGTQVAAPPAEGEKDPVIFETERELVVTAAQLQSVFVRNPEQDQYGDYSAITDSMVSLSVPAFQGNQAIEHIFYIGDRILLGFPNITTLILNFTLASTSILQDERDLKWEFWDGIQWQERQSTDSTENLKQSGTIAFDFSDIPEIPTKVVNSQENRWLRCRLTTPITLATQPQAGMVRSTQLPSIHSVTIQTVLNRVGLAIEAAFTDRLPIDLSKPFFPFGEKPKFGDTLYLANREAFSKNGAAVTLDLTVIDPVDAGFASTDEANQFDPKLQWEFWDSQTETWLRIGVSTRNGPVAPVENNFRDTTNAFTNPGSGQVSFTLPPTSTLKTISINGVENVWIRVRIIAGNYGIEATYIKSADAAAGYEFQPATFVPPLLSSLSVSYELTTPPTQPEKVLIYNDFTYQPVVTTPATAFKPFQATEENSSPTLYLGLTLPPNRASFSNLPLSLFCHTADFYYGEKLAPISPTQSQELGTAGSNVSHQFWLTNSSSSPIQFHLSVLGNHWIPSPTLIPPIPPHNGEPELITLEVGESRQVEVRVSIPLNAPTGSSDKAFLKLTQITPVDESPLECSATLETFVGTEIPAGNRLQVNWQYWNGQEWVGLTVRDDSENFTRQGIVEFLPPADFASKQEFGLAPRYWLRAIWKQGRYAIAPRLKRLLLNTTMAAQTVTLHNEVLGSSDGTENQRFRTTRAPVLEGQQLEVRELEMPSAEEQQTIAREEGDNAITPTDSSGRTKDVWVRWHEVADFYGSSPRDRHYVIDHLTGDIQFGNGLNGLIPPIGTGNVRLVRYQTGGGARGNKAAGTIVQLKTTVPYVEKVTNPEAAAGGADAENLDDLRDRIPKTIRHRNRAVTIEDYEDLALLASPEVVRAKCVPLRNLSADPLSEKPIQPGEVSVIIVPKSTESKALPSQELISRVQDYLQTYSPPTVNVSVAGPLYLQVNITAEIALVSLEKASAVEQSVEQTLTRFLHPLTGSFEGTGWDFGREPHDSDFYRLMEGIPGVDHIRYLKVTSVEEPSGAIKTGRFLVYSGKHSISLVFEPS